MIFRLVECLSVLTSYFLHYQYHGDWRMNSEKSSYLQGTIDFSTWRNCLSDQLQIFSLQIYKNLSCFILINDLTVSSWSDNNILKCKGCKWLKSLQFLNVLMQNCVLFTCYSGQKNKLAKYQQISISNYGYNIFNWKDNITADYRPKINQIIT